MFFTEWCAGPKFSLRLNLLYFGPLPNSVSSSVTTYGKVRQCCDIVLSAFFFCCCCCLYFFIQPTLKLQTVKAAASARRRVQACAPVIGHSCHSRGLCRPRWTGLGSVCMHCTHGNFANIFQSREQVRGRDVVALCNALCGQQMEQELLA